MDQGAFDQLWADQFGEVGFVRRGTSQSMTLLESDWEVSILRPYGRFVESGTVPISVVFRHQFLRPVISDRPDRPLAWGDYLRGARIEDVAAGAEALPFQTDTAVRDTYCGDARARVAQLLPTYVAWISDVVVVWARGTSPQAELDALVARASGRWDEGCWIEDYRMALAR